MTRACTTVAAAALLTLLAAGVALAGPPTDQLRTAIDRVMKVLDDPALKGDSKVTARRSAVRKVAEDIFDFKEIARRSLGRHWQGRTDKERDEFTTLFGGLLERSYIGKIDLYGGEKIQYTNERVDGDIAMVATRVITKSGTEVPVEYRLIRRADRWLVYDVVVEGVSLISNYRTQFNKIIQTSSYGELVKRLRAKQDELAEDGAVKKPRTQ